MVYGNPLGNPLGLPRTQASAAEKFLGPALKIIATAGDGEFTFPEGASSYRITAVGGGAAGTTSNGGASGAVAIKSGIIPSRNFKIKYTIGSGGSLASPDGSATIVTGTDINIICGGGVVTANVAGPTATGGDTNIQGLPRTAANQSGANSTTGPGSGSGNAAGNVNGGGAGYAGGISGAGLNGPNTTYSGGNSTAILGAAQTGLNSYPTITTVTTFSGGDIVSGVRSGNGGIGGGGGGRGDTPGIGGVGVIRIEWW